MKSADWVISEAGLQSLMGAGISIGWVKAWVYSAGVTEISIHLLESDTWQDSEADWQLFFATIPELNPITQRYDNLECTVLKLDNPARDARCYTQGNQKILLLPIGDITYQRHMWLSRLHDGIPLSPLYVCADSAMPIKLESGLSAGLMKPADDCYLNAAGLLIEEQVIVTLKQHKLFIRTAESCTGGGISARLCRVPGASAVVDRAWVTYTNQAKQQEVGVDKKIIAQYGAVSEKVVMSMAEGGADSSHVCIAVSGIAGPDGGTNDKPVGTVWIAVALNGYSTQSRCLNIVGARYDIQNQTIVEALCLLLYTLERFR